MAEELILVANATREEQYQALLPQVASLIQYETDSTANLANTAAALKQAFGFLWVGFYLEKDGQLVLGPFQGPIACTRIPFDKGVCGASYSQKATLVVPDVEQFPGHIACSSDSKSEVVVPIIKNGKVLGVLDVDSELLNDFSQIDKVYLEQLMEILADRL